MRSPGSFFNVRYVKMRCLLIRNRFYDTASHRETPFGTRAGSCECIRRTINIILHITNNIHTQEVKINSFKDFIQIISFHSFVTALKIYCL